MLGESVIDFSWKNITIEFLQNRFKRKYHDSFLVTYSFLNNPLALLCILILSRSAPKNAIFGPNVAFRVLYTIGFFKLF